MANKAFRKDIPHIDISHTRKVVQALAESGLGRKAVFEKAQYFLRLVQKHPDEKRPQPVPGNISPVFPGRRVIRMMAGFILPLFWERIRQNTIRIRAFFHPMLQSDCDGMLAY
ncbi:MAG: hypothetical protein R3B93_17650 [Bacteroidia bacterium]